MSSDNYFIKVSSGVKDQLQKGSSNKRSRKTIKTHSKIKREV
jgi:hypothetical protein